MWHFLPLERRTFHNVIILFQSIQNKDKISFYYNIFLEKTCYELPKK